MSETTFPDQPSFHYSPCAGPAGYPGPSCYLGRVIQDLVINIEELGFMAHHSVETSARACPACPALALLKPAAELIAGINQFLDDLPAADCPDAASFNLSNIRPPLQPDQPPVRG